MRTDFHTHLYPQPFYDVMVEVGREDFRRANAQDLDPAERIASQDAAGIDRQILSLVGRNFVVEDAGGAVVASQCLNDIYADICEKSSGRMLAFAMLPLPHVEAALKEISRALAKDTCVGVALPCSISGRPLDDPMFDPIWAELDARGSVVFLHPVGEDSSGHWGMDEFGMGAMFGSPMQLGIAACRLVFSGVTSRFPNVRILLGQGGGFLPSRWQAIENTVLRPGLAGHAPYALGWTKDLGLDPENPMSGFRNFWYDTATMHQAPTVLATVKETCGLDRLVLGSDALFGSLTESVSFIETTDLLTDTERTGILNGGAVPLLVS